jgi:hypothetical protein
VITGFPGETEADFESTKAFLSSRHSTPITHPSSPHLSVFRARGDRGGDDETVCAGRSAQGEGEGA